MCFPMSPDALARRPRAGGNWTRTRTSAWRCWRSRYVATVHGAAYHMSPYLRISTATADDDLVEGLRRIQMFCEGLH